MPLLRAQNAIEVDHEATAAAVEELDYDAYLSEKAGNEPSLAAQTVKCKACGAQSQFAPISCLIVALSAPRP